MDRIALKVQRRRYARAAVYEVAIHKYIQKHAGPCEGMIALHEAFLHDDHVCIAYERHGRSLSQSLERGPLPLPRVRQVARQVLGALQCMHSCGYAHTDVKPDNILYDGRTGQARLTDLGNASNAMRQGSGLGTREYTPPEVLLGTPPGLSVDLWALGCTVFEMLTGEVLFHPRKAAAKKYREFSSGPNAIEVPLAESERLDRAAEAAEQLAPGDILAGKYQVRRRLGRGGFATVWAAERISDLVLDGSYETLWGHAEKLSAASAPETEEEGKDRVWRERRGAEDLLDLALNYEHLLLIAGQLGSIPAAMIADAQYRAAYFADDGAWRFGPARPASSWRQLLEFSMGGHREEREMAENFLDQLLQINPAARPLPAAAMCHPWLATI